MLLLAQPQSAFALEDEHGLVVREMEMERKCLLARLQLEPARADARSTGGCAEPLSPEGEAALLHDLVVALHQRGLVHAFFPSCTRGFCPRGTAVMFASATRSATFCAIRVSAWASGRPGSAATTGRPSSLPTRIAGLMGTRPRNGTPSLAAACSAPPLEKMSVSWWQWGQTNPLMFSTNPSTGMFTLSNIVFALMASARATSCGVVTTTAPLTLTCCAMVSWMSPVPEPTRTTFFTEGTRSLGLCCLAGEGRTLAPNATSTRGSCSGESMARTASSIRALCGEAGVGSSTRTRTPPPSSISGCLKYPSSDIGRPDEGSLRSFNAERTCSAVTPIGRRNVRGAPGQVKASGGAAGRDVPSCASRCRGRAVRSPPRTEYLPDTPSVSRTWRYPGWSRDRTRPGPPSCPPGSTRDPAAPAGAPAGRSFSGPPPRP